MAFPKMQGSGKPSKFSRPTIDLSKPNRKWQEINISKVQLGDTIPDFGEVVDIHMVMTSVGDGLQITGAGGKVWTYTKDETIFAFTTAK